MKIVYLISGIVFFALVAGAGPMGYVVVGCTALVSYQLQQLINKKA